MSLLEVGLSQDIYSRSTSYSVNFPHCGCHNRDEKNIRIIESKRKLTKKWSFSVDALFPSLSLSPFLSLSLSLSLLSLLLSNWFSVLLSRSLSLLLPFEKQLREGKKRKKRPITIVLILFARTHQRTIGNNGNDQTVD